MAKKKNWLKPPYGGWIITDGLSAEEIQKYEDDFGCAPVTEDDVPKPTVDASKPVTPVPPTPPTP